MVSSLVFSSLACTVLEILLLTYLSVFVRGHDNVPPYGSSHSPQSITREEELYPGSAHSSAVPNAQSDPEDRVIEAGSQFALPRARPGIGKRTVETSVDCVKTRMIVTLRFSEPFNGLVYPHAQYNRCVLSRSEGTSVITLTLAHGPCGQDEELLYFVGRSYVNPIIEHRLMVQWERDVISEDDVSVVVRCERPDDYNKTVTWSLETRDLAPRLERSIHPGPQMWMEIQRGEGPNASPLSEESVTIGEVLTLIFVLADKAFWFDSNVLSCFAIDGSTVAELKPAATGSNVGPSTSLALSPPEIQVIENGCSVKPKIFSHMHKERRESTTIGHSTLHYTVFKAFRFPTSRKIQLRCHVQVCYRNCSELPQCSEAFHPRAAVSRRRRSPEQDKEDGVVEVNKVNMLRSLEVLLPEEINAKNYVVSRSPLTQLSEEYCFRPATYYGTVIGLVSFIILLLFCLFCWRNLTFIHGGNL